MKISELPELLSINGTEYLAIVSNGSTYKVLASLLGSSGTPPTPPNSLFNDEFNASTLDASWVWQNQDGSTATVSGGFLDLYKAANGINSERFSSLYKTPPEVPWTATMRITSLGGNSLNTSQGITIGDSSGKLIIFDSSFSNSERYLLGLQFSSPTAYFGAPYVAAASSDGGLNDNPYFVRIQATSSTVSFRAAATELGLVNSESLRFTEALPSFLSSVSRIGFNVDSRNSDSRLLIDWIRFT